VSQKRTKSQAKLRGRDATILAVNRAFSDVNRHYAKQRKQCSFEVTCGDENIERCRKHAFYSRFSFFVNSVTKNKKRSAIRSCCFPDSYPVLSLFAEREAHKGFLVHCARRSKGQQSDWYLACVTGYWYESGCFCQSKLQ